MRYRFLRFPDGKTKAVTFSYDDSRRSDIRLSEVITSYGIKGTFNINSTWLGKSSDDEHLTPEEIEQYVLDRGHEVAIHGARHGAVGNLRAIDGIREVLECRLALEKIFGRIIRGMAYADSASQKSESHGICQRVCQSGCGFYVLGGTQAPAFLSLGSQL